MRTKDQLYGLAYFFIFLIILPFLLGGIPSLIYWAARGEFIPILIHYGIGFIVSGFITAPFIDKIYLVNDGYICSFWLDPLASNKGRPENERLICRPPGGHFRAPWEQFDSTTRHERDIEVIVSGTFETLGASTLNIKVKEATLVLDVPIETARILRSIGKGMLEIETQIKKQLEPSLKQAIATEFAARQPDQILLDPDTVARAIMDRFTTNVSLLSRYNLISMNFALGDLGFSDKAKAAREKAFEMECLKSGIDKLVDGTGVDPNVAAKLVFGSLEKDGLKVHVYDITGVSTIAGAIGSVIADAKDLTNNIKDLKK